jgi:hypothetical protein
MILSILLFILLIGWDLSQPPDEEPEPEKNPIYW